MSPRRTPPKPAPRRSAQRRETATRVLRQFRRVFNAVKTHFQQVEKSAGMGGAQVWALSIIKSQPDLGINDLASAMDVHQSTASNLIKGLVERDLVKVVRSDADRRSVHLRLTAAGSTSLRKAPMPFAGVLPEALAALDERVLERLHRDLGALLVVLQTDRRAARTPLADL